MALALADAGADVVITGRTPETLEATAGEIRARGREAWTFKVDMGVPADCQAAWSGCSPMGPIDILINNVGNREVSVPIRSSRSRRGRQSIDLNLTSCFLGTKIVGEAMLARGEGGRIINIASISALIANRGIGGRDYETGKAAVLHFTRCAAADWAPHGITVNAICPGLFMTDINRQWNERRPDVIEAFVQNVPMGRAGRARRDRPAGRLPREPRVELRHGAAYVIDGGYTVW